MVRSIGMVQFDDAELEAVCRRFGIRELFIFGSAARGDLTAQSDVDLLVEYESGRRPGFIEFGELLDVLHRLFVRRVDLVEGQESIVNPYRRATILPSLERLYAA